MKMQSELADKGVMVLGVTRAPAAQAQQFQVEHGLNYPVLADAQGVFDAYGVEAVWGSVIYLVSSEGKITARGIDAVRGALAP
ncbi:MAG: peroxiredoxin family protein [Planctomycetota bacterium]